MNNCFRDFRLFLMSRTGIQIDEDRYYLVQTRLSPLLRKYSSESVENILDRAMSGRDPELTDYVIEAMLTGETFFFRDRQVFDALRKELLPEIMSSRAQQKQLRIWCAACSTGQEPYSLAMMFEDEAATFRQWQIEILATDISEHALEIARAGSYNQFEVQRGLPVTHLLRYFGKDLDRWRIDERIRSRIRFQQLNLIRNFSSVGSFDLIFCRNVLMYFDQVSKHSVMERLVGALRPGGILFLGATENVAGHDLPLTRDLRAPGAFWLKDEFASAKAAPPVVPARALQR